MTPDFAADLLRQALMTALWLSAPILLIGFAAGIVISLVQIVTSIQDTGFSTIPRLAVFVTSILLLMPWMLRKMAAYTVATLGDLGRYAR
ncbi:MAG TPA: flagellar biosynthetic protein FliQ [Bryobacteraceae bacterium]|nr:flagellar biosynthetic protein FliQ [Bryobacteraceae bacterium]HUJ22456.1 flagellar biosynthetic protein FliQ [Bryobacteraceae bacterium]